MAVVERGDIRDADPFGGRDHGRVHGAEREVVVAGDELGDSEQVCRVDGLEREVPGCQVAEESDLGLPAEATREQVGDLGDDEARDEQWAGMRFEQLEAG
jgi:hypothetical protein